MLVLKKEEDLHKETQVLLDESLVLIEMWGCGVCLMSLWVVGVVKNKKLGGLIQISHILSN